MNISEKPLRISKLEFIRFFGNIHIEGFVWQDEILEEYRSFSRDKRSIRGIPVFIWNTYFIMFTEDGDDIIYSLLENYSLTVTRKKYDV